jgi:hypothetical protein
VHWFVSGTATLLRFSRYTRGVTVEQERSTTQMTFSQLDTRTSSQLWARVAQKGRVQLNIRKVFLMFGILNVHRKAVCDPSAAVSKRVVSAA